MKCDHIKILDLARDGNWDEAHKLVQQCTDDKLTCLIHAYLHRIEGNMDNAKYWYSRIGVDMPNNDLEDESNRLYTMISNSRNDNT